MNAKIERVYKRISLKIQKHPTWKQDEKELIQSQVDATLRASITLRKITIFYQVAGYIGLFLDLCSEELESRLNKGHYLLFDVNRGLLEID